MSASAVRSLPARLQRAVATTATAERATKAFSSRRAVGVSFGTTRFGYCGDLRFRESLESALVEIVRRVCHVKSTRGPQLDTLRPGIPWPESVALSLNTRRNGVTAKTSLQDSKAQPEDVDDHPRILRL